MLREEAPSIFSVDYSAKLTDKYVQIPTIESVRALREVGYLPIMASETRSKDPMGVSHAKHMIRFRRETEPEVGGIVPELILVNSHNGTAAYNIRGGVYRFVCANGLVVGNDHFSASIKHIGNAVERVVEESGKIQATFPEMMQICDQWSKIQLTKEQQLAYGSAALLLKYDSLEDAPIKADSIIQVRRFGDMGNDVFTTFNRVQENLIRGGIRYRQNRRRNSTRNVTSVNENLRINKALWMLTEKLAQAV
jgi:hypothetical protein